MSGGVRSAADRARGADGRGPGGAARRVETRRCAGYLVSSGVFAGSQRAVWFPRSRLGAAAILVLAFGGAIWMGLAGQNQAMSSAQTIDQVVSWNLSLSQSDSA